MTQPQRTILQRLSNICWLSSMVLVVAFSGCRQAAYNELYVEQMNTEARLLEDRIYEYDSAYRELELEVEALHQENERLRLEASNATPRRLRSESSVPSLGSEPDVQFETMPSKPRASKPAPMPVPDNKASEESPPDDGPAIEFPASPPRPNVIESEPLEPPSIEIPGSPSALNDVDNSAADDAEVAQASEANNDVVQAVAIGQPAVMEDMHASEVGPLNESSELDSIDHLLPGELEDELESTQAFSPHLMQQEEAVPPAMDDSQAVVELAFHPAFTRGIDADNVAGEEGIRLVIQPKTSTGQVTATEGYLTIVAVDPNATNPEQTDAPVRLGRWTFSAEKLQEFYESMGSAQGYRFELGPLSGKPVQSEVILFARMEYEDGRKLVNQFTVHLDTDASKKPIWTARAK